VSVSSFGHATVLDFFARMNAQRVEYAVLRNYEQYPNFGHDIDLVVRWSHLPRWREIAKACASDHAWNALTECNHWAQSSCPGHTIQILRFYRQAPLEYLQIDAFHAYLVNSLPLLDEDVLLDQRIWDERGFYRIDERAENFFRLFQIARLALNRGAQKKVESYRNRALSFWAEAQNLAGYGTKLGFPRIAEALDCLRSGDLPSLKRRIDSQKRAWWAKKMLVHPLHASRAIVSRSVDYARLFYFRPCGFTVRVSATAEQRRLVESALVRFVDANFIRQYALGSNGKLRRQTMERGGIAIVWESPERADWIIESNAGSEDVTARLAAMLIARHNALPVNP